VTRSGQGLGTYSITEEIERLLNAAELVICDLSADRPNVYFELGYARALGKPLICTARRDTKLPFDVSHPLGHQFAAFARGVLYLNSQNDAGTSGWVLA
jgi:nucleoside 2-deoxyribosyltransferase